MKITRLILLAATAALSQAGAADRAAAPSQEASSAAAPAAAPAAAKVPYHGTVSSIDPAARTFRLKGREKERVFALTPATKIMRDGVAVELSAMALGEEVRGQAVRNSERWDAVSILLGAKAPPVKAQKAAGEPARE